MPFAEINGNRLYFEDSYADGPAVIFCHGAFLDHTIWEPQVNALSGTYRCITWDQRGHGMSESGGSFTFWDSANDAVGLMDHIGLGQAVLVGMSQGGWLSQRAALTAPDRVRGLVLQGTSVAPLSEQEHQGYGQLADAWLAGGPVGDTANAILGIQFSGTDYDGSRYIGKWQGKAPSQWADAWDAILKGRDDITGRMPEIACPVHFVHGTNDAAFPVEYSEQMSSMVQKSTGVDVIEGGPHCASLTHPEEMTKALSGFMQKL